MRTVARGDEKKERKKKERKKEKKKKVPSIVSYFLIMSDR